jgi:hypothetical protein
MILQVEYMGKVFLWFNLRDSIVLYAYVWVWYIINVMKSVLQFIVLKSCFMWSSVVNGSNIEPKDSLTSGK